MNYLAQSTLKRIYLNSNRDLVKPMLW